MSPAARTPYAARRAVWLRVLVLLLALLVPGTTAQCGVVAGSVVTGGTAAEYDVHDTALRPPGWYGRRPVVPLRPAPRPPSAQHPVATAAHPLPVPPPPAPHALRSVVLRC